MRFYSIKSEQAQAAQEVSLGATGCATGCARDDSRRSHQWMHATGTIYQSCATGGMLLAGCVRFHVDIHM